YHRARHGAAGAVRLRGLRRRARATRGARAGRTGDRAGRVRLCPAKLGPAHGAPCLFRARSLLARRDKLARAAAQGARVMTLRDIITGRWRAVPILGLTQILAWGTLYYPP